MPNEIIARASVAIRAPVERVWDALVNPQLIKKYMFGTTVRSDFKPGSPITWKGEWKGKPYEDQGTITKSEPQRLLQYDHYSPLTGPDVPENHHQVTICLAANGPETSVELSQDNNASEEARQHSEKNWKTMLAGLKKVLEDR